MAVRIPASEMRILGALMLIFSCGSMGISRSAELRNDVKDTERMLRVLQRMRIEICQRKRSLTESMSILETEYMKNLRKEPELTEKPFYEIWQEYISALGLPAPTEEAIIELGKALTEGETPETAFRSCGERLSYTLNEMNDKLKTGGKVCIAAGFAAGCLLAIAVI